MLRSLADSSALKTISFTELEGGEFKGVSFVPLDIGYFKYTTDMIWKKFIREYKIKHTAETITSTYPAWRYY